MGEWEDLFLKADPCFVSKAVYEPEGSASGILEVVRGEEN